MNLRELERSNYERVLEWAQFFDKVSKVEDTEGILFENLENHLDLDISGEFEEAEEDPEENLQDEANLSNASSNNTIANINKFIALNPNLPLIPIRRQVSKGSYEMDSEDDDIQQLLNETIPIVIEHKRRLKEAGIDRILDTFDTEKIEKEVGEWLLRNHNVNNALIDRQKDMAYTTPYQSTNGFNRQKFNESYESDEESMHSVDTARYILSNQKRYGGKKQKFGSTCTTTTTIKTYCLMKSKRDALNRKYKTYPEHYEAHIKDILDRRCSSQVRARRDNTKPFGVSAESHNINKRRKHLRKRVTDHYSSIYSTTDSSDDEIHEKYFRYQELKKTQRSKNAQKVSRKRNFKCCCSYRCRCGRRCNVSGTSSSYLSSQSFENKHRARNQQNLELDMRPCIRESECDCVNEETLCSGIRHLADTSTERWIVHNSDSPLKEAPKMKKSLINSKLLKGLDALKQSPSYGMKEKLNANDVQNYVEKTHPKDLELSEQLLKCEIVKQSYSSDVDEVCKVDDSCEIEKQNIVKHVQQNVLSTEIKKELICIENAEIENINVSSLEKQGSLNNSYSVATKDLGKKKYESKKEKAKNRLETNINSVHIDQEPDEYNKLPTKQMLEKQKSHDPENIATTTQSKESDVSKKKYKSKKEKVKNPLEKNSVDINKESAQDNKLLTKELREKDKISRNSKKNAIKKLTEVSESKKSKSAKEKVKNAVEANIDVVTRESNQVHENNECEKRESVPIQIRSPKEETQKFRLGRKAKKTTQTKNTTDSDYSFDKKNVYKKKNGKKKTKEEPPKKLKKLTKKDLQKQNGTKSESDESKFDSDLQLALALSKQQFTKENKDKKEIARKKEYADNVSDIENKNDEVIQAKIKQESISKSAKSSILPDDTFFKNSSLVCNSTALINNIATSREIPTYLKSTSNNQTLNASKSDSDYAVVTSTTNDLENAHESSELDIGQQTKKGILIYTPTKKTSAPAHSFSDGCFNITQDHLGNVIGQRSASKFLKYYLGPRRFDANATVYYKPPMSTIMDEDTDSSEDGLECVGLIGDLHVSLNKDAEKT